MTAADDAVREETRRLGLQYGKKYFADYGRSPSQHHVGPPYQVGEPFWHDYFDRIADFIVAELAPRTTLDAGCGIGFLVQALRERDIEAFGIDISEYAIDHVSESVRDYCRVGSITDELDHDYDLISCIEVLEHLPPHLATPAIANLGRHANNILFSASSGDFADPTHLNVQPTEYWVELLGRQGFFRDLDVDASVVSPQAIHFRESGQTTVSVALAYERWHWRHLEELRELRRARHGIDVAGARAERVQAEAAELAKVAAESELEIARLTRELDHHEALASRALSELDLLRQTRTFRYTRGARSLYGHLRQGRSKLAARDKTISSQELAEGEVRYSIDAPRDYQEVPTDCLVPLHGWVVCEDGPVARVDISVNGSAVGQTRLGLVRSDVGARIRRPYAWVSGFEGLLDLSDALEDDPQARIELHVETLNGRRHALEPVTVRKRSRVSINPKRTHRGASSAGRALSVSSEADIRLLVFTHHLGLGGGQLYLFELLRLLAPRAEFAATLVAPADGALRRATEELGIPVVIQEPHPVGGLDEYEARQGEIAALASDAGFNAILSNTFGTFPGVDLAERLGVPALWAIHESFGLPAFWHAAYGSTSLVHPGVKERAEHALASASAVIFEADATRELFAQYGDPGRFVTVPYGIDIGTIERFAASISPIDARRELGIPQDATLLLCLGTVEPRKGQGALVEAFRAVADEYPKVTLALVGARADASSEGLRQFIAKSGLSERVRLVPVTPSIYEWYRAADALVCASDVESLPRTVLEAMAFSVPVIATRVFGLPELIDDGVTGYLCEPRDLGELVGALRRFLQASAEVHEAVGAAGASLVRERHDSRYYADAYLTLLRALVEDPGRLPSQILAGSSASARTR